MAETTQTEGQGENTAPSLDTKTPADHYGQLGQFNRTHGSSQITALLYEALVQTLDPRSATLGVFEDTIEATVVQLHRTLLVAQIGHNPIEDSAVAEALNTLSKLFTLMQQIVCITAIAKKRMTRREAARILNVHENTVASWVKNPDYLSNLKTEVLHIWVRQAGRVTDFSKDEVLNLIRMDEVLEQIRNEAKTYLHKSV